MSPEFEWDARKARDNFRKHRVAFEEALTVFADPLARIFDDPDHSEAERRELLVGHSEQQRLLVVSFAERQPRTRIITPEKRRRTNGGNMKKTIRSPRRENDDVRPDYEFDYSRAKPNRFASQMTRPVVAVVLDSDVAAVFDSSAKVNAQLRSAMAERKHRKPARVRARRRRAS